MADFVEIITKQGVQQINDADAALNRVLKTLNVVVSESNKLNLAGGSSAKPSQYNANTAKNNAAIERNIKLIEKQRIEEIKLNQARERAFDKYEQALTKEQSKLQSAQGVYSKVQQKLNQLNAEYRNLAVQKELTGRLTDSESKRYDFLSAKITKYDTVLKGVDASMGKYQRNVGNYASAFNPLSNSVNQLTRELPAFANSVQTGFMAISNNLPIFFDAIQQINAQNKILAADGKQTQSTLMQLANSVFSLGTALSIGVTLLTLFGDDIVKWAGDLFKGKDAVDALKLSTEQLNDIRVSSLKSITQERIELANNLSIAKDTTLSYKDREIAAQNILDQYPYWFESLGKEAILNGNVEKAVRGVNEALLARALANAAVGKITENQSKFIDLDQTRIKLTNDLIKAQESLRTVQRRSYAASNAENQAQSEALALGKVQNIQLALKQNRADLNALSQVNNDLSKYALEQAKEAIGLEYETVKAKKEKEDFTRLAETNSKEAFTRTISRLEEELSLMNIQNGMYGFLQGQLNLVKGAYEALYGEQEKSNEETERTIKYGTAEYYQDVIKKLGEERDQLADTTEQYALYSRMIERSQDELDKLTGKKEDIKKLTDEVKKYLDSFSEGFLNEAKLPSFNMFLSINEDGKSPFQALLEQADTAQERFAVTFNAIAQSAQEAFAFMNQNSQAYFDAQYAALDRQKAIQLQFTGDSESGKAEIERQYEERRRAIRIKEAQANKQQAIFNIALNTAQGITAALASVPPNVPLSIVIGAIGAAQIGLVASRQIPQYKDGTDNHKGGLAVVGDGGKHEAVYQPTLGWSITPNKDTLVNLEKGSKVFPDLASSGIFDSGLPDMIQLNGNGITVSQMDRIMKKHMPKSSMNVEIGKNGIKTFVRGQYSQVEKLNNNVRFKA